MTLVRLQLSKVAGPLTRSLERVLVTLVPVQSGKMAGPLTRSLERVLVTSVRVQFGKMAESLTRSLAHVFLYVSTCTIWQNGRTLNSVVRACV